MSASTRSSDSHAAGISAELAAAARSVIWFEPPEQALANPHHLLCYAMQYATPQSFDVLRRRYGLDAFRDALRAPPPGILDARSWR